MCGGSMHNELTTYCVRSEVTGPSHGHSRRTRTLEAELIAVLALLTRPTMNSSINHCKSLASTPTQAKLGQAADCEDQDFTEGKNPLSAVWSAFFWLWVGRVSCGDIVLYLLKIKMGFCSGVIDMTEEQLAVNCNAIMLQGGNLDLDVVIPDINWDIDFEDCITKPQGHHIAWKANITLQTANEFHLDLDDPSYGFDLGPSDGTVHQTLGNLTLGLISVMVQLALLMEVLKLGMMHLPSTGDRAIKDPNVATISSGCIWKEGRGT
ncbi:hypothetical protein EDC04DRAFT_2611469 [Pisolithus marmoratus]|nr:hypothetical protein EDC04DRAFT_2611469 [Pisolithus marmoratus]